MYVAGDAVYGISDTKVLPIKHGGKSTAAASLASILGKGKASDHLLQERRYI